MKNSLVTDTLLIAKNELMLQLRNLPWLFFGLFQPVVYLVLFSPFLTGLAQTPGFPGGSAIDFFAPGLLVMNVLFGSTFAGFGLIDQLRSGFIERIRVTPVARLAIVLGLVLRSPVVLIVQCTILLLIAIVFFGLHASFGGILILFILMAIIGITMASLSYTIALIVKEEGALAATTNFFILPLFILSGIMLPIAFAPKIIQTIAKFNPFAYAVDAARALMSGDTSSNAPLWAFLIFIALGALALRWFIRTMREAVA